MDKLGVLEIGRTPCEKCGAPSSEEHEGFFLCKKCLQKDESEKLASFRSAVEKQDETPQ